MTHKHSVEHISDILVITAATVARVNVVVAAAFIVAVTSTVVISNVVALDTTVTAAAAVTLSLLSLSPLLAQLWMRLFKKRCRRRV